MKRAYGKFNDFSIILREEPSQKSERLGLLDRGEWIEVLQNGILYQDYEDGRRYYSTPHGYLEASLVCLSKDERETLPSRIKHQHRTPGDTSTPPTSKDAHTMNGDQFEKILENASRIALTVSTALTSALATWKDVKAEDR